MTRADASDQERLWARKLGRLRLGAEPLAEQLTRFRRVTWVLTGVSLGIALIMFALFTGFGSPLIGLAICGILFLPIILWAWLDLHRLELLVAQYESERRQRG